MHLGFALTRSDFSHASQQTWSIFITNEQGIGFHKAVARFGQASCRVLGNHLRNRQCDRWGVLCSRFPFADSLALPRRNLLCRMTLKNPAREGPASRCEAGNGDLIRMITRNNSLWGAPRVHGKLLKLGAEIYRADFREYVGSLGSYGKSTVRTSGD